MVDSDNLIYLPKSSGIKSRNFLMLPSNDSNVDAAVEYSSPTESEKMRYIESTIIKRSLNYTIPSFHYQCQQLLCVDFILCSNLLSNTSSCSRV